MNKSLFIASRAPASYTPDDDVIAKPVENELSFYQQYVQSDQSEDVIRSRNQLKIWHDNQIYAQQWGLQNDAVGSTFYVPTSKEKFEYFKQRYMRYLRGRSEQPFKDIPKEMYQQYRASNEIDTIDEMEARFREENKDSRGSHLPTSFQAQEVSLWKKTKFIFQPRVDQGLVILGFKSPIAYARAWVGVNGKTELNVQQTYDSVGIRMMMNYEAKTGEYFSSVDKKITDTITTRYINQNRPQEKLKDQSLMLLYVNQF